MGLKEKLRTNKLIYPFIYKIIMWIANTKKKIHGRNNKIINLIASYNVKFHIDGNNNLIQVGDGSKLSNLKLVIIGDNNKLLIGECSDIKGGVLWISGNNCLLKIGNFVSIEECKCAVAENNSCIIIGNNCLFSYGIDIKTSDSHSIIDIETKKRINPASNIEIKDRVWIGSNATILKGVTIGENAIIGTSSVVTKDVPSNSVVGGNPAKILKKNVTWDYKII